MAKPAIATLRAATAVADWLASIGEHKKAEDVRRVCRSNATYRVTLQQLHRDNMALRRQLAEAVAT